MAKYRCTYCQNTIETCRIKCAECPDFDLCLQCFACGAEAGPHKKEHDYHVFDDGYVTVFESDTPWYAREEEALLEAVEHNGFGNWDDTASHVENRSTEECKEHYYEYYIHGNIGKCTFPKDPKFNKVIDHTSSPDGGPLSPSLTSTLPPVELTPLEQQELGYMPLRDDFERDYDNEAESLVSSLSLNYDDEDIDVAFKLAQVDIYRQRLKERTRRKRVAREYGVIAASTTIGSKKTLLSKKKLSKEEKDFQEKMRVFSQFHSAAEHDKFFENLQKEKQIKARIKELIRLRRNGITKFDEIAEFEAEKYRRDKRKDYKKKMPSTAMAKRSMASKKELERLSDVENREDIIGDRDAGALHKHINGTNGQDLLSECEKRLCNSIGMKPSSYITIKTCIIKDYLQRKQGVNVKIRYPSHLDKTHRRKILNFLTENGWIGSVA